MVSGENDGGHAMRGGCEWCALRVKMGIVACGSIVQV